MLSEVKDSRAYGNAEVVQLLEIWLSRAREGKICHATITVCQLPNLMACDFAGVADMDFAIPYALDTLKLKLGERHRIDSGPVPKNLTADYVCYNLGSCPTSFDFLTWLIEAEMTRIREGSPSPLKVAFARGQDGKAGLNTDHGRQMFGGVMRPLLGLIGAIEDQKAIGGRRNEWYVLKGIVEASRNGEAVPKLKPSIEAVKTVGSLLEGSPVTITFREQETWKHRNSNIEAWLKFSDYLESHGEQVIFVRDTAKAGEPLLGKQTFPLASMNLDVRMALYERAKCNLFIPTGPWNLAIFGTRPWLAFNAVSDEDPYICNRPKFWSESQGISVGEQFPWSSENQRIIWEADEYEVLRKAWDDLWRVPKSSQATQETSLSGL